MLISEFARKTASQPIRCASGRPQQDIVSAFSVLLRKLRRFCSALRALINYLVPQPRLPGLIVFIAIGRDAWHSEQCTNASKQVLIL
jgi:hypothetical protein